MAKTIDFFFSLLTLFLTGVLLVLAFPNYHLTWLAWIAFVPLLIGIRGRKPWQAFLMCWFCGVVFYFAITPWISDFPSISRPASWLGYLYLSLYFALFGLFLTLILRRIEVPLLVAAPIWVVFEYLRSNLLFLSFPCVLLGHTQYLNLPIIQIASFTGVYGVSFVIMLTNGAITDLINCWVDKKRQRHPTNSHLQAYNPFYGGLVVLAIFLVLWVAGWRTLSWENSGRPFSVAVVQGNIPQEIKWNREYREKIISKYENLTEEAAKANPKLIAWPEASTPGFVLKDMTLLQRMVSIVRRSNAHLLVGSAEYPKFDKALAKKKKSGNTALFLSPEGKILGQYIKIRLVPFGEYVPFEGSIPWPEFIVRKDMTSHISGEKPTLFEIDGTKFGTLICWEILFPDLIRSFVKKGAGFVINISNEAWFGKSAVPHQILSMSIFRAVENRVNLVRATNTGVSCFIDPYGRITNRITNGDEDIFIAGTLTQEIRLSPPGTFYTRYGDVLAYGCIAFSLGLVIWVSFKRTFGNSHA